MASFILLFILWFAPIVVCYAICDDKHRNPWKGAFLGVFFGWFAAVGLWLALKRRDPKTQQLC